jgi:hypothetical protein
LEFVDDHAKPGDSEEGKCQVTNGGQRTYPRGQIDGKFQVAKTTQAGANLVSALSRAQASSVTEKIKGIKGKQVCWDSGVTSI